MIYIFLIVCFYILYDRLTISYLNPYKLIMVFGKKGSGKTTFLTKIAIKNIKKGRQVFSTIEIPGTKLFDVEDLGDFTFPPNSVVLIDEVGIIWDNRNFKNFRPEVRDYFKYQRQYKNTVYLFSQTFDVDLKLRNLTDEMYLLKSFGRVFSILRKINKNITIQEGTDGRPSCLVDNYEFASIFQANGLGFTFIPRYVKFFNSYDPPFKHFIKTKYFPMSEEQRRFLSNMQYLEDRFYTLALFSAKRIGQIYRAIVKSPMGILRHTHRGDGRRKTDFEKDIIINDDLEE